MLILQDTQVGWNKKFSDILTHNIINVPKPSPIFFIDCNAKHLLFYLQIANTGKPICLNHSRTSLAHPIGSSNSPLTMARSWMDFLSAFYPGNPLDVGLLVVKI